MVCAGLLLSGRRLAADTVDPHMKTANTVAQTVNSSGRATRWIAWRLFSPLQVTPPTNLHVPDGQPLRKSIHG
jgi:hypothetical protein